MAIFGVGAYYDYDVSDHFLTNNLVGVGWGKDDAPELQQYFISLKVGDIVYIKAAFGGADITVKGIGVISDNVLLNSEDTNNLVTSGRNVKWLNKSHFKIPRPKEKNNVRSNTVYEEFHPEVQKRIIELIAIS